MEQSPLLKKVYDSYKSEDWVYTQDNLNPVREVSPGTGDDIDDLRKKALEKISAKVAKIRDELEESGIKFQTIDEFNKDKEESAPFGTENVPSGLTPEKILENLKTGRPLDYEGSPFLPFSKNGGAIDTLISYIEYLIASLGGQINPGSHPVGSTLLEGMIYNFIDIGCNNSTVKEILSDISKEDFSGNLLEDDELSGGDSESEKPGGSSQDDSNEEDDQSSETDLSNPNDILATYDDENNRADARDQKNLMDCAMKDLTWLMIILIILKIILMLVNTTALIMGIISPVMRIATLAAGAWVNPVNIAQIVQDMTEKAMAIMLKMVADLCQMMWDLLNMDCISVALTSAFDKFNNLLGTILDTKSSIDRSAVTISNNINAVKDSAKSLQELLNKAKENAENNFGIDNAIKNTFDQITGKDEKFNEFLDVYSDTFAKDFASNLSSVLNDTEAKKLINDLAKKQKTTEKLISEITDDSEGKSSIQRASSIISSRFENINMK